MLVLDTNNYEINDMLTTNKKEGDDGYDECE